MSCALANQPACSAPMRPKPTIPTDKLIAPILPRKRHVNRLPLLPRRNRGDLDLLRVRALAGAIQRDAILARRSVERVAQAARAIRLHRLAGRVDNLRLAG